jgi:2-hydroxychromene-2-carboxylate isomerase
MRSPYSYLALPRVLSLSDRMPIELALRPVLPMVMRGLPVPSVKRMYILKDAAREARRLAIPFGRVSDPLGAPIERLYALFPWARSRGRERDLLWSFGRAAWAEGIDTGADAGMRKVVERAGLTWADAEPHLREEGWRDEIEANRRALVAHDLWGVPSFALFDGDEVFTTWGQDRIGLLEAEIARRVEA